MAEESMDGKVDPGRRALLKSAVLAGTAGVLTAVPVVAYVVAPATQKRSGAWVNFGSIENLGLAGIKMLAYKLVARDGWLVLPRRGVVWAKTEDSGGLTIFSSVCPHLGCTVSWREKATTFECPCHSASFDANGRWIAGPSKEPLAVLPHKVEDGNLLVLLPV